MSENKDLLLEDNQTCPAVGYQSATVCVPITVRPFANALPTFTKCCGNPVITSGSHPPCAGSKNGSCTFTISQVLCVSVPVEFGAVAEVGDTYVNCNGATSEDICSNCDKLSLLSD